MAVKTELNYANGMNQSAARKICRFLFGHYFKELKINHEQRHFEIYVYEKCPDPETDEIVTFEEWLTVEFINHFKNYFCSSTPGFKLYYWRPPSLEEL